MAYDGVGRSFGVTPTSPLEFMLEAMHPFGGEICPISQSGRGFRVGSAIFGLVEVGEHDEVGGSFSRCKKSKGACPLFPRGSAAMRHPKGGTGFTSTDVSGEISCIRATREGLIALKVVVVVVAPNLRSQLL